MLVGQGKKFELWSETQWAEGRDAWLAMGVTPDADLPAELQNLSI